MFPDDFPINNRWPAKDPSVLQLYSFPTPNGVKVSIMLEETGLPYEPHRITLADADVKSPEFLSLNPNNKIPAIIDPNGPDGAPLALGRMKGNLNLAAGGGSLVEVMDLEADNHTNSSATADHREAASAFVEKRKPVFKGV